MLVDHVDGSLIVFMQDGGLDLWEAKLIQNGAKVLGCLGSMYCGNELSFSRTDRDSSLELALIGNCTTSKSEDKASNRTMGSKVSDMGSINKAGELQKIRLGKLGEGAVYLGHFKRNRGDPSQGIYTNRQCPNV